MKQDVYEILLKWFWEFPVAHKFELGNTFCIQLIYHTSILVSMGKQD